MHRNVDQGLGSPNNDLRGWGIVAQGRQIIALGWRIMA